MTLTMQYWNLWLSTIAILTLLLLLHVVTASETCITVAACPVGFQLPISENLKSYEIGTTDWNSNRKLCPRSDIALWEFTVVTSGSSPVSGEYCIYESAAALVDFNDVCVYEDSLIFMNNANLKQASGTVMVDFTSPVFNATFPIQFAPTGIYVPNNIVHILSNIRDLKLEFFIYLPNSHTTLTITHDGVEISNGTSNIIEGYGSLNFDQSACVPAESGGEVTVQYIVLMPDPTEKFVGEYNVTVDSIYSDVITVELDPSYTFSSAQTIPPSSSSSAVITPSTVSMSPSINVSQSIPTPTQSPSVTTTPVSSSVYVSTTTNSLSVTSSSTPVSSTPPTTADNSSTILIVLVIVVIVILLFLIIAIFGVPGVIYIRKSRKRRQTDGVDSRGFRRKKISTVEAPLSTNFELSVSIDRPRDVEGDPQAPKHVIETRSLGSSTLSDGSRRFLIKPGEGVSSLVSSGSSTPRSVGYTSSTEGARTAALNDVIVKKLDEVQSEVRGLHEKVNDRMVEVHSEVKDKLDEVHSEVRGLNEKVEESIDIGRGIQESIDNARVAETPAIDGAEDDPLSMHSLEGETLSSSDNEERQSVDDEGAITD